MIDIQRAINLAKGKGQAQTLQNQELEGEARRASDLLKLVIERTKDQAQRPPKAETGEETQG